MNAAKKKWNSRLVLKAAILGACMPLIEKACWFFVYDIVARFWEIRNATDGPFLLAELFIYFPGLWITNLLKFDPDEILTFLLGMFWMAAVFAVVVAFFQSISREIKNLRRP